LYEKKQQHLPSRKLTWNKEDGTCIARIKKMVRILLEKRRCYVYCWNKEDGTYIAGKKKMVHI